MTSLKIFHLDEVRRASFADETLQSYHQTVAEVAALFGLKPSDFRPAGNTVLQYVDDDGDAISITNDNELREAFQFVSQTPQGGRVLRLRISELKKAKRSKVRVATPQQPVSAPVAASSDVSEVAAAKATKVADARKLKEARIEAMRREVEANAMEARLVQVEKARKEEEQREQREQDAAVAKAAAKVEADCIAAEKAEVEAAVRAANEALRQEVQAAATAAAEQAAAEQAAAERKARQDSFNRHINRAFECASRDMGVFLSNVDSKIKEFVHTVKEKRRHSQSQCPAVPECTTSEESTAAAAAEPTTPKTPTAPTTAPELAPCHANIICDGCNKHGLVGSRFKCCVCPDFDLCASCEAQGMHADHLMLRIRNPMVNSFENIEMHVVGGDLAFQSGRPPHHRRGCHRHGRRAHYRAQYQSEQTEQAEQPTPEQAMFEPAQDDKIPAAAAAAAAVEAESPVEAEEEFVHVDQEMTQSACTPAPAVAEAASCIVDIDSLPNVPTNPIPTASPAAAITYPDLTEIFASQSESSAAAAAESVVAVAAPAPAYPAPAATPAAAATAAVPSAPVVVEEPLPPRYRSEIAELRSIFPDIPQSTLLAIMDKHKKLDRAVNAMLI